MACESQNLKLGFKKLLVAKTLIKLISDLRGCWFRDKKKVEIRMKKCSFYI